MPPHPSDDFASDRAPRHAAEADSDGRHRRPESLADSEHLRPAPVLRSVVRARSGRPRDQPPIAQPPGRRRGRRDPRGPACGRADRSPGRRHRDEPRRSATTREHAPPSPGRVPARPACDAGRSPGHHRPAAQRRTARGRRLGPRHRRPAAGHRLAPGARHAADRVVAADRQDAGSRPCSPRLVAVGLALVMIPTPQRDNDVDPVNAADQRRSPPSRPAPRGRRRRSPRRSRRARPPRPRPASRTGESPERPGTPAGHRRPGSTGRRPRTRR